MALPAHMLMAASYVRNNVQLCASAAQLQHPASQWVAHKAYALAQLLWLGGTMPPSAPASHRALPPAQECATVLTFLQLSLGLALPALAQAAVEAHLWRQHQQQRRQLGIPDEKGWQQRLYGCLLGLLDPLDWFTAPVFLWVLLGLLLEVSILISSASLAQPASL